MVLVGTTRHPEWKVPHCRGVELVDITSLSFFESFSFRESIWVKKIIPLNFISCNSLQGFEQFFDFYFARKYLFWSPWLFSANFNSRKCQESLNWISSILDVGYFLSKLDSPRFQINVRRFSELTWIFKDRK